MSNKNDVFAGELTRSYAKANLELVNSYERYLIACGNSEPTRRAYLNAVSRLVESIGSTSVVTVERSTIREVMMQWHNKGLGDNSIRLHRCALRSFFKFLRFSGITKHDPMLLMGYRKVPTRIPLVLTVEEVEKLIDAAEDPFERAVPEVLYSTGVRVSELVKLRLEDISWPSRTLRVHKGKSGKDRVVLFGSCAEKAIREYQKWRPSQKGFLFEAPPRIGHIYRAGGSWKAIFSVNRIPRTVSLGPVRNIPTKEEARAVFNRLVANIPGFHPLDARPYHVVAIRNVLNRLAHRAGIGHVHPHALRRAMASHMLQRDANLRVVQELLGHEQLNTTMLYTHLDAHHLKAVHEKCHPHEQGDTANAKKE